MIKVFGLLLLLIMVIPIKSSETIEGEYTKEEIEKKIASFGNMRTVGIIMICIGAPTLVTGIVMFANAISKPAGTKMTEKEMDDQITGLAAGWICMGVGIPVTIAGGVLTGIGNKKHTEYKNRLNMLGGYNYKGQNSYVKLVYNF